MSSLQKEQDNDFKASPVQPFELKFDNINVIATVDEKVEISPGKFKKQKAQKTILNRVSGIFEPNTFTAIVGPSGCGKTTMLNLLSGRLLSQNLELDGQLYVNGKSCFDIGQYETMIGYIMQQDLLMATFTPRQSFRFVADLRLIQASEEQKSARVQQLIKILGLTKCSDTYVGGTMIRGVSGGEKRRVSIGVQLLTNPSMIFLDQPTTGLDSTTSLHLMQFLNRIAKSGRTIVSTIHQPSSEIFQQFDRLIIMVGGNMVYQGQAKDSMSYFGRIGFPIKKNSNPTDYYMRIMNKEGLSLEYLQKGQHIDDVQVKRLFQQRVTFFKQKYAESTSQYVSNLSTQIIKGKGQGNLNFFGQVYYITKRAVKDQMRNPLDVSMRILQMLVQGFFCAILYYKESNTVFAQIQNVTGCLSFLVTTAGFSGAVSSISTFSTQRSIFIRQRMNNTYSTGAYFIGRNLSYTPLQLFLPLLFMVISYFSSHLDNSAGTFFLQLLAVELTYIMSSSYGLIASTAIKQFDVALSILPVLIIPLMLVSGFFVSLDQVPKFFYWMEYLSMFKYGYEAVINRQYRNPVDCGDGVYCDLLQTKFKFKDPNWLNFFLLALLSVVFRLISYVMLEIVSSPKRIKLGNNKNKAKMLHTPVGIPIAAGSSQALHPIAYNNSNTYQNQNNYSNAPSYPNPNPNPYQNNNINQNVNYDENKHKTGNFPNIQQPQPQIIINGSPSSNMSPSHSSNNNYPPSSSNMKLKQNESNIKLPPVSESMSQLKHDY